MSPLFQYSPLMIVNVCELIELSVRPALIAIALTVPLACVNGAV